MKVSVLGIQIQDYVSRRTNQPVKGISLHCYHPDARVDGMAVESLFISERLPCYRSLVALTPGWDVNIEFDSRGSIVDAQVLDLTNKPDPAREDHPGIGAGSQSGGAKK